MSSDLESNHYQINLKRANSSGLAVYEFEGFRLNAAHLMLYRNGEEISLPPKQVETLLALIESDGEIVSKDELMDRLWANSFVEESNLIQNIYILRKILGETADGKPMIETLRRRGYRFNGELKANKQTQPALAAARINDATEDVSEFPPGISDKAIAEKASAVVPSGYNRPLTAFAPIVLLVGAIALGYYFFSVGRTVVGGKKSIAVLPLKPINTATRDEIYEVGIADSLINQLNSMKGFVVRPLSATRQYADIEQDPIAAGREQQVDHVLASNYQLAGGKIRVTSQLFDVASGQIEETYKSEKEAGDFFAMQDAVADEIGRLLLARFATTSTGPAAKRGTTNEEAYRFYLQGMFLHDRGTARQKAVEALEQSVRLDPNYAQGWAGLAVAHRAIAYSANANIGEEYQKSIEAINKALSLDPNISEAYTALCEAKYQYEWDFAGAGRACQRALE
ncbi:MAG: winged helix-turn-helix domain-containing protein, partial [Acidobacteriota bacterium]|nr:winged helix-turn-helix domain-containing protein [Acidobacteriota bacterium]